MTFKGINGKFNNNVNLFVNKKDVEGKETKEVQKAEEAKTAQVTPKKAEASALNALGWQNMGLHLGKVDTSNSAVAKRMEAFFANSPEMKALNAEYGIEEDLTTQLFALVKNCDNDKLRKYAQKPLDASTTAGVQERMKEMISLA